MAHPFVKACLLNTELSISHRKMLFLLKILTDARLRRSTTETEIIILPQNCLSQSSLSTCQPLTIHFKPWCCLWLPFLFSYLLLNSIVPLPPKVSPSMLSSPLSFFSSHPCPLDLRTTTRWSFQSPTSKDGQDRGARRGKITTAYLERPRPREDETKSIGWVRALRRRDGRCWKLEHEEIKEKKPQVGERWLGLWL